MSTPDQEEWREFLKALHEPCPEPIGTRIRLLAMPSDPCPIPEGAEGTVSGGNGAQMWVAWDSDRTLCLLPLKDSYEVIK